MISPTALEKQLEKPYAEIQRARQDASARIGTARRVKLGDLNLREDFYREMTPLLCTLYHERGLRRVFFRSDRRGRVSRELLLVYMSELIYWEYERSFWRKLDEALGLDGKPTDHNWFRHQMELGYEENDIALIVGHAWWQSRKEYVRTIVAESGFSRRLVQQAKSFVVWFFDHYSDLDPRTLDAESFDEILTKSGFEWDKEDVFELLRDMIRSVSRLLREIRRRSLTSTDFQNRVILTELQDALGFHPVRGIFGFRKEEDIQDLLERVTKRVRPRGLYMMLQRKARMSRGALQVITPEGQSIAVRKAKDVPVYFGQYRLFDPHESDIQVVPREALPLSKLADLLRRSKRTFHVHESYAWIHDEEPFEIYQGSSEPEMSRRYCISGLQGHLWYGKQKIGIPLRAERNGSLIDELDPRRDVWLNPRLRLNRDKSGLQVVIPSFVCYEPGYAGHTVRLELNRRPVEDTTYVIGRNGALQFQGTRVAEVHPDDTRAEVCLVAIDQNQTVAKNVACASLRQDFLFNAVNRERVRPGHYNYAGDRFVLFHLPEAALEFGDGIERELLGDFGPFEVWQLYWIPDCGVPQPFELKVGDLSWKFTRMLELRMSLLCVSSDIRFRPQEQNASFDPDDVKILLHLRGQSDDVANVQRKLSLVVDKDDEFLTDFSLSELQRMEALCASSAEGEYSFDVGLILNYLLGQRLTDRRIGAYRWTLMLRSEPLADLEPVSTVEFLLLPELDVEGTEAPMAEGKEALVAVSCNFPLLLDEDRPTNVLPLACVPQASFDRKLSCVRAESVSKTVRLAYPPTKVAVMFVPKLFAVRLVCGDRVRRASRLTYSEAKTGSLVVLTPLETGVFVAVPGFEEEISIDSEGRGRYSLASLLPTIHQEHTTVEVSSNGHQQRFQIVWHTSLQFNRKESYLDAESVGERRLILYFDLQGPPEATIVFKVSDNRFRSHGQHAFPMSDVSRGRVELPIDLGELKDATFLYCTASVGHTQLDTLQILCRGTTPEEAESQMAEQLQEIATRIHGADAWELLQISEQLELVDDLAYKTLAQRATQEMYSARCLDQLYEERNKTKQADMATYLRRFEPSLLPEAAAIPKLKKYCAIPAPRLQLACAERLIIQGDGVGVEEVIDLISQKHISWDEGVGVLSQNRDCTSEMVRDIVRWDDLELEDEQYIELMEKLSEEFHPPMARRARTAKDWKRALDLLRGGDVVNCEVANWNPSGVVVALGMIVGEVPVEEIDARKHGIRGRRFADRGRLSDLVGTRIPVIVIDANRREGCLILSEKQARQKLADQLLRKLVEGEVRSATVTGLAEFGAFVDLDGVDGLIHISELSWEMVKHPKDVLSIGDEVQVRVLSLDRERRRVSLSRKALLPDPLLARLRHYQIGQTLTGKVTKVTEYGAFVSVEEGVTGLVHISELSDDPISHPQQLVKKGDELTLRVLRVDEEKRGLVLSLKQVGKDDLLWGSIRVTFSQ